MKVKLFLFLFFRYGLILGLLFRKSEYGLWWSQMDIISLEKDSMTKNTLITCITLNVLWKTKKNFQNVWRHFAAHFGILPVKKVAYGYQSGN